KENHLRWDSLGEFLAIAVSLEHLGATFDNADAIVLSKALDLATEKFLNENKSPSRKVNELDNRGSHFYLAMYWAQELAAQSDNAALKAQFAPIAEEMEANEAKIIDELNSAQGVAMDIGGYFRPDPKLASAAMRPSMTFNAILEKLA
ncbi:MAG: NADP-dependent isocitrate dehydrogenase, partial [Gammaproteobacteria bacterium]|nr:NADP-dependent isocitrate dehydrogenase [Gammaproteobacteria bacterium]